VRRLKLSIGAASTTGTLTTCSPASVSTCSLVARGPMLPYQDPCRGEPIQSVLQEPRTRHSADHRCSLQWLQEQILDTEVTAGQDTRQCMGLNVPYCSVLKSSPTPRAHPELGSADCIATSRCHQLQAQIQQHRANSQAKVLCQCCAERPRCVAAPSKTFHCAGLAQHWLRCAATHAAPSVTSHGCAESMQRQ
jgi:hypothetical protein